MTAAEALADEFAKVTSLRIPRAHAILKTVRRARSVPDRWVICGIGQPVMVSEKPCLTRDAEVRSPMTCRFPS